MPDLRSLADRLRGLDATQFHVVTLPDFFLDHFVPTGSWDGTTPAWRDVHGRGGGNVPTPGQHFQPGGNAANTALALARMGVRTHLLTRTSDFGRVYLEQTLGRRGVDLKHVKSDGQLAVTTAIEFQEEDRPANLMLSDPGSVAQFGPECLDANDWTLLAGADLVLLANWSQNRRGTALVEEVTRACARHATMTMLDTGDPSARGEDVAELRDRIVPLADLDVYALNENELRQVVGKSLKGPHEERAAAETLAQTREEGALDLHTSRFAATYGAAGKAVVPTFRLDPLRVTGAGDAWNAGNILGHLAQLSPEDRLTLANAVAGLYVTGKEALAPTLAEVAAYLESAPPLREP